MAFKGTIIDVRTRAEFNGGHVNGSINIPLQEITEHIEEIKTMEQLPPTWEELLGKK